MPKYIFQAGNTPLLSLAELRSLVETDVDVIAEDLFVVELEMDKAKAIFKKTGGSVKLFELIEKVPLNQEDSLISSLASVLTKDKEEGSKITFALAHLGEAKERLITLQSIKNELKDRGFKVRFIDGPMKGLSSAVLSHQRVDEAAIILLESEILLSRTAMVQDIDHWSVKDRGKPYADRKKGMLPPKVGRMMLNLALGKDGFNDKLIYDPFCGTGTVLIEAMDLGANVVGSDLDEKATVGSKINLAWFAEQLEVVPEFKVFKADVARVNPTEIGEKVDAIVTEPYLGKPKPDFKKLPGIFDGLKRMYLGAFKQWTKILKPGGRVVMVMPRINTETGSFSLEGLIDKLSEYGYTSQVDLGDLNYHRPQAIVQRDIMILTYNQK